MMITNNKIMMIVGQVTMKLLMMGNNTTIKTKVKEEVITITVVVVGINIKAVDIEKEVIETHLH